MVEQFNQPLVRCKKTIWDFATFVNDEKLSREKFYMVLNSKCDFFTVIENS